ncbi:BQ2448_836 [Microbotryum intermedium]|uniref:BQ2448_836 protein n=1 Tax=Microbotryum intermedium TaxID=269621 RepID=A0A238F6D4_9BASI|nr:BQ2448_836 [Microbotryum intermedium]
MPQSTDDPPPASAVSATIPRLPPPQFEPRAEGQPRMALFTGTSGEFEALNRAIKRPRHVQSAPIPSPPLETAVVDADRGRATTVEAQQTPETAMATATTTATTSESASASTSAGASAKRPRLSSSTSSQSSATPSGRLPTHINHEPSPERLRSMGASLFTKVLNRIVLFRQGEAERRARWGGDPRLWDEYSAIEFALVSSTNEEAAFAVFPSALLVEFKKTLHGQWLLAQAAPFSSKQFEASMKRVQSLINHLRALYCSTRLCQALPSVDESHWIDIARASSNLDSTSPRDFPSSRYHSPPLPATVQFATSHARPETALGNTDRSRLKPSRPLSGTFGSDHPPTPAASSPSPAVGELSPAMPTSSFILPPRHRSRLGIPGSASLGPSSPPTTTPQTSKHGSTSTAPMGVSGGIVYGSSASWNASPFLSSSATTPLVHRSPLAQSPHQFQAQLGPPPPPSPPRNAHLQHSSNGSQLREAPQSVPGPLHPHPQWRAPTHQSPPLIGFAGPFPPQQPPVPIEAELQRIYEMGILHGRQYEHEHLGKERATAEAEAASQAQAQARLTQVFARAQAQTQAQVEALARAQNRAKVQKQSSARAHVQPLAAAPPDAPSRTHTQSSMPFVVPYRGSPIQNQGPNIPHIGASRPTHFSETSSPTLPHTQPVRPDRAPSPTEQFRASLHRPRTAFIEGAEGLPDHFAPVYVLLNLAATPEIARSVLVFLLDTLRISTALDVLITQLRNSARQFIKRPPADHHQLLVLVVSFYNAFAKRTADQLKSGRTLLQAFDERTLRVNQSEHAEIVGSFDQAKNADRVCEVLARAIETWHMHVNKLVGPTPAAVPARPPPQSDEMQVVPLLLNSQAGVRPSPNQARHLSTSLGPSSVGPPRNGTGASPADQTAAGKPSHRASRSESFVAVPQILLPKNNARAPPTRLSTSSFASAETAPGVGSEKRPPSRSTPPQPQPVQLTARDRLRAKRDELVPALEKALEIVDSFQQHSTAHQDYAALVQRFEAAQVECARQSAASASPTTS